MIKARLHPDAVQYVNGKADELLKLVKPLPSRTETKTRASGSSKHHPSITLKPSEYKVHWLGSLDSLSGELVEIEIPKGDKTNRIGLDINATAQANHLVKKLADRREIRDVLGEEFIRNGLIRWIGDRYKEVLTSHVTFLDFLDRVSSEEVKPRMISAPIRYLSITHEFRLGKVQFSFLPKDLFDRIEEHNKSSFGDNERQDFQLKKLRLDYQGKVIASINVEAESQRSLKIAKDEIGKTLEFLRFFSPAVFNPQLPSYFDLFGRDRVEWTHLFTFTESDFPVIHIAQGKSFQSDNPRDPYWDINQSSLEQMQRCGIPHAHDLLLAETPTDADDTISSSVLQFGRSLSSNNFHDKVVFAFVAIETLLLANDQEHIGKTLVRRLTTIQSAIGIDRGDISSTIDAAANVRSNFIHHGRIPDENLDLIQNLRGLVWQAIQFWLVRRDHFTTKRRFLAYLDDLQPAPRLHLAKIDHVEFFVPDRLEAAAWYERVLGLEILPGYEHWSDDPGGPLMISPDGGNTKLALFTGTPQGERKTAGFHLVAFRVGAEGFVAFLRRLPDLGLLDNHGNPVTPDRVSDHASAFSLYFSDPYGHRLELTTYDVEETKAAFGKMGR